MTLRDILTRHVQMLHTSRPELEAAIRTWVEQEIIGVDEKLEPKGEWKPHYVITSQNLLRAEQRTRLTENREKQ